VGTVWTKEEIKNFLEHHFTYREPQLSSFKHKSWFFYGDNDVKYKKEVSKLGMNHYGFSNKGHRFLFEDPELFKTVVKEKVL